MIIKNIFIWLVVSATFTLGIITERYVINSEEETPEFIIGDILNSYIQDKVQSEILKTNPQTLLIEFNKPHIHTKISSILFKNIQLEPIKLKVNHQQKNKDSVLDKIIINMDFFEPDNNDGIVYIQLDFLNTNGNKFNELTIPVKISTLLWETKFSSLR